VVRRHTFDPADFDINRIRNALARIAVRRKRAAAKHAR